MNIIEQINIVLENMNIVPRNATRSPIVATGGIARAQGGGVKPPLSPGRLNYVNARSDSLRNGTKLMVNPDGSVIKNTNTNTHPVTDTTSKFMKKLGAIQSSNLSRWSPKEVEKHGAGKNFASAYLNSFKPKDPQVAKDAAISKSLSAANKKVAIEKSKLKSVGHGSGVHYGERKTQQDVFKKSFGA